MNYAFYSLIWYYIHIPYPAHVVFILFVQVLNLSLKSLFINTCHLSKLYLLFSFCFLQRKLQLVFIIDQKLKIFYNYTKNLIFCSFELFIPQIRKIKSWFPQKYYAAQRFSILILIIHVSLAPIQHITMISCIM